MFLATPAGDLRRNYCDMLVKDDKKLFVESQKSRHPLAGLQRKSRSQGKQIFLPSDQLNFKEKSVSSFLATDIPFHKLKHPALKALFATIEKVLPSEAAARASVAQLAAQKKIQFENYFTTKTTFLIVDDADVAKKK